MNQTISILVKGRVQGVFYRKSARDKALELGLSGEVKNQADGSVYILANGTTEQLEAFIEWCKQGPPRANVTEVLTSGLEFRQFSGFIITR